MLTIDAITMLDPAALDEWADALESGKYKQTHNYLCCNGHYCCLGVLAEEAGLLRGQGDSGFFKKLVTTGSACNMIFGDIPNGTHIIEYAEKHELYEGPAGSLAELNDGCGWSFDQIAELLRAVAAKRREEIATTTNT